MYVTDPQHTQEEDLVCALVVLLLWHYIVHAGGKQEGPPPPIIAFVTERSEGNTGNKSWTESLFPCRFMIDDKNGRSLFSAFPNTHRQER